MRFQNSVVSVVPVRTLRGCCSGQSQSKSIGPGFDRYDSIHVPLSFRRLVRGEKVAKKKEDVDTGTPGTFSGDARERKPLAIEAIAIHYRSQEANTEIRAETTLFGGPSAVCDQADL
jgi:hypothetical protein